MPAEAAYNKWNEEINEILLEKDKVLKKHNIYTTLWILVLCGMVIAIVFLVL